MNDRTVSDSKVRTAIDDVLAAESEMVKSMQDCKALAERIVNEAHEKANAIRHRAERRIGVIRQSCSSTVKALQARAAATSDDIESGTLAADDAGLLREAVARMADSLTGAECDARDE